MNSDICIVSLGTGNPDYLNSATIQLLQKAERLVLRTGRHPVTSWLHSHQVAFSTLDSLYDEAGDFEELNMKIADYLSEQASEARVVYAVSDAVTDNTVRYLLSHNTDEKLHIEVIPGSGMYDFYLTCLLPYLSDAPVVCTSAYEFLNSKTYDPNHSLLITELDNSVLAGQLKIMLSEILDDEHPVYLVRKETGTEKIPLYQLDRQTGIDHFSALFIRGTGFLCRNRFVMNDLTGLMETLRSPEGCPWDRAQSHRSLRPYLIEEAWECVASIDENDMIHFCEELGDLLFQIVFHSSIGASYDEFSLNDVVSSICMKMIRRHPHVFADGQKFCNPEIMAESWEKIKQKETGKTGVVRSLDDVSPALPSLKYAAKILKKLNQIELFRKSPDQIMKELSDCIDHIKKNKTIKSDEKDLGTLLVLCAELCFALSVDGELVLHQSVESMKRRVKNIEKHAAKDGKSLEHLTFSELGVYLNHVEDEKE